MQAINVRTKYSLNDFKNVNLDNYELPQETIDIINELAQHVGAPTYRKTPVFKKNDKRYRENNKTISNQEWEEMRNFKPTNIKRETDGIEKQINELRMLLNKLTNKNYEEIHNKVSRLLKGIIESSATEEDLIKVGKYIFDIGSVNKFWSKLYAKLYKDLINIFPVMNNVYKKNLDNFMKLFEDINTVEENNDDYELLCKINKENSKRKSISSFFVYLMKEKIIDIYTLENIIKTLINKFRNLMNDKKNKLIIDEITENLFILINNSKSELEEYKGDISFINDFIQFVINCDYKNIDGISSKTVFKFLDLNDE
jgi:hypothetical protein